MLLTGRQRVHVCSYMYVAQYGERVSSSVSDWVGCHSLQQWAGHHIMESCGMHSGCAIALCCEPMSFFLGAASHTLTRFSVSQKQVFDQGAACVVRDRVCVRRKEWVCRLSVLASPLHSCSGSAAGRLAGRDLSCLSPCCLKPGLSVHLHDP